MDQPLLPLTLGGIWLVSSDSRDQVHSPLGLDRCSVTLGGQAVAATAAVSGMTSFIYPVAGGSHLSVSDQIESCVVAYTANQTHITVCKRVCVYV